MKTQIKQLTKHHKKSSTAGRIMKDVRSKNMSGAMSAISANKRRQSQAGTQATVLGKKAQKSYYTGMDEAQLRQAGKFKARNKTIHQTYKHR